MMHAKTPIPIIPPELLLRAYRSGIFPMADGRDDPDIFWVEPKIRAILPLDGFHLSHSLRKTVRSDRFHVTCNAAFDAVIDSCAAPRPDADDSWISMRIAASYGELHRLGYAHSIECWHDDELVGGLYGVGFGRAFCGESMFSRMRDSSKVAMAWLVAALRRGGVELLDCQFITPHLASLGAREIPQAQYVDLLREAQRPLAAGEGAALLLGAGSAASAESDFGAGLLPAGFAALLEEAAGLGDAAGLDAAAGAGGPPSSPGNFIAQSLTQTS